MIDYPLCNQIRSFNDPEMSVNSVLANQIAALFHSDEHITWAGIYMLNPLTGDYMLDMFQGLPACMKIAAHKGVIGAAVDSQKPIVVSDVHQFDGHIACDSRTESEMVIPLKPSNILLGVLDLDSDVPGFFDKIDPEIIEELQDVFTSTFDRYLPF